MLLAEGRLNRREALLGAGVVGAGALVALMPAAATAAESESRGLEGAWLIQVTPEGGTLAPHQVLALYTKGGGVIITSSSPPNSGSPGLGAWERIGENQYREIFETFTFDSSGQVSGLLQIRTESTVDDRGDHQTGRAHIYFQPAGTSSLFPAGSTHYVGSRISVLPL